MENPRCKILELSFAYVKWEEQVEENEVLHGVICDTQGTAIQPGHRDVVQPSTQCLKASEGSILVRKTGPVGHHQYAGKGAHI